MQLTPVIRDATEQDIDFLARLQVAEMRRELALDDEALLRLAVQDAGSHLVEPPEGSVLSVIEVDQRPVGRLRVVRSAEQVFLAGIQLVASERGQRIGSTIIGRLLDEARSRHVPLRLRVHRANTDARRLYARLGFEQDGEFEPGGEAGNEIPMSLR